jgi:D-alanyl-D-alanine carboxypeptidase
MNRFQAALDEWRLRAGASIVTAAVRLDGSLIWSGVSIESSVENAGLVSPRSRFPIYSITKTFTAVCILRLDAVGLVHLDDPIRRWIVDMPVPRTVLLSHLLRHTSGIPDYGSAPEYHAAVKSNPSTPWTDDQVVEATLVAKGLLFEPGTSWSYSNVGYLLLRRVIEWAVGSSFRQCVAEQIVAPLCLRDTFVAEAIDDWESCVPGYGREVRLDGEAVDIRASYHPGWCAPGVAVSTVDDVTMFYEGLFDGVLLDERHLDQMLQLVRVPGTHPPAVTPSYGMGIMADPDGLFGPSYGRGGGGPGYSLFASILPQWSKGRLSVAVFCNNSFSADAEHGVHALFQVATA